MRAAIDITEKNIKEIVDVLDSSKFFCLDNHSTERADLYVFAMALGYKRGYKKALTGKKNSFVRTSYLNNKFYLFSSLYFDCFVSNGEKSKDDLVDHDSILNLAEEYANTGFEVLKELYTENKDQETLAYNLLAEIDESYELFKNDFDIK